MRTNPNAQPAAPTAVNPHQSTSGPFGLRENQAPVAAHGNASAAHATVQYAPIVRTGPRNLRMSSGIISSCSQPHSGQGTGSTSSANRFARRSPQICRALSIRNGRGTVSSAVFRIIG